MHTLKITLKQHTPLIHFQHDQEGATLRASEVKPKLDKFILQKLGEKATDEQIEKGQTEARKKEKTFEDLTVYEKGYFIAKALQWLVGKGDYPALDYKMRIESDKITTYLIPDKFPLYFGNMGDINPRKEFTFCDELTTIILKSFYKGIMDICEQYIYEFFLLNNFGTRQSKGFGSFYIDNTSYLYKGPLKTEIMDYRFMVDISGDIFSQWKILFEQIELFYKLLRSGINICNRSGESIFYMKSMMFKYAKREGLQWDKKSIKEKYYPQILDNQQCEHPDMEKADVLHFTQEENEKRYLFKDYLGLSTSESWRIPYKKNISKKDPSKNIERFKSPIIFKPIRIEGKNTFNVFFKGFEIPEEFIGKDFNINDENKENLVLTTYPDFTIADFLDYSIFDVDLEELVGDENYLDNPKFITLEKIFNQIRKDYGL